MLSMLRRLQLRRRRQRMQLLSSRVLFRRWWKSNVHEMYPGFLQCWEREHTMFTMSYRHYLHYLWFYHMQ